MTHKAIVLLAVGTLGWTAGLFAQEASNHYDRRALSVSLIRVIANPQDFDGRRLRIVGYLGYNGVDRSVGVYVSEVDGRNAVLDNSIDLELKGSLADSFQGQYVIFEGTYHAGPPRSDYNGHFDQILDTRPWNRGNPKK